MAQTLYLNNVGDRYVILDDYGRRDMRVILEDHTRTPTTRKVRRPDYIYTLGNYGGYSLRVRGKRVNLMATDYDPETGLPVLEYTAD